MESTRGDASHSPAACGTTAVATDERTRCPSPADALDAAAATGNGTMGCHARTTGNDAGYAAGSSWHAADDSCAVPVDGTAAQLCDSAIATASATTAASLSGD